MNPEMFYTTGKPCRFGHMSTRYVSDGTCTECRKLKAQKLKAARPEYISGLSQQYRSKNKPKIAEYVKAWRLANKQRCAEIAAAWAKTNPEKRVALMAKRRAARTRTAPMYSEYDEFVFLEAADIARRRTNSTSCAWDVDHMIPLLAKTACGLHIAENIQVIPRMLNQRKNNRLQFTNPLQWMEAL